MSTSQILTLAMAGVLVFWAVGALGRLAQLRRAISAAWAVADAHLRRRGELAEQIALSLGTAADTAGQAPGPRLVAAARQLAAMSAAAGARPDDRSMLRSLALAEQVLACQMAWVLQPPADEDAAAPARSLRDELAATLAQLSLAAGQFNAAVQAYNDAARQFPTVLLAGLARLREAGPLVLADAPAGREPPGP